MKGGVVGGGGVSGVQRRSKGRPCFYSVGAIEAPSRSHLRGCKGTMSVGSIAREEAEDGEEEKGGAEGGEGRERRGRGAIDRERR